MTDPPTPPETFILIPGRAGRQGTALYEGKFAAANIGESGTLLMCPDDMARQGLNDGDRTCPKATFRVAGWGPTRTAPAGRTARALTWNWRGGKYA
jgi:hypothetical protein